jgi:hypothetical protein
MMVLAFVIGMVPSYKTLGANAASGSGGRVDMVDLLDAVLNLKAGDPVISIQVAEPRNGVTIKVPEDTVAAPLYMKAIAIGGDTTVAYGIDGIWGGEDWEGEWYSAIVNTKPYHAFIDLLPLLPLDLSAEAHWIYAFAGAQLSKAAGAFIQYTLRSDGPDDPNPQPTEIIVVKVDQSIDADKDGLPDQGLFDEVSQDQIWLASYDVLVYDAQGNPVDVKPHDVVIGNLNPTQEKDAAAGITVSPEPNISITAPSVDSLVAAGVLYEGQNAVVIAEAVDDLSTLLGQVNGSTDPVDKGAWGAMVSDKAPGGGLLAGARFIAISLLAEEAASAGYREIAELPAGLSVDIEQRGLTIPAHRDVELWSFPIRVIGGGNQDFVLTNVPGDEDLSWAFRGTRDPAAPSQGADEFIASVTQLSVFGAFQSAYKIDEIYPNRGPVNQSTPVRIKGDFGATEPLTLNQVRAAYAVYFDDMQAVITAGLDLAKAATAQYLYVDSPPRPTAGSVPVIVTNLQDPSLTGRVEDGYTYLYSLTTYTSGSGSGTVALSPPGGLYGQDDVVQLTANPAADSVFVEWQGDLTGTVNPTNITMNGNKVVTAVFALKRTLTVQIQGNGTVGLDPTGAPPGTYVDGQVVTLTATPDPGNLFAGWELDLTGSDNPAQITMNADKTVRAVFTPSAYTLSVMVSPVDGAGIVLLAPPGGTYPPNQVVILTAVPNTGYLFDHWEGAATGPANPTSVTMNSNKSVTAVFVVPGMATLTLQVTPPGTGTIIATPPGLVYAIGATVGLMATANSGYRFVTWQGDVANPRAISTTIVMTENKTVTAEFQLIPTYTLTILPATGGHVDLSPPGGAYLDGTPVTLTAVPDEGFAFFGWLQDLIGSANPATLVMNANKVVQPQFTYGQPVIDHISPNEAWLFGGVKASIVGQGFKPTATVTVDDMPVAALQVTPTAIYLIMPALEDTRTGAEASIDVVVQVTNPPGLPADKATGTFRYKRFATAGGVTTTAFYVQGASPFELALNTTLGAAEITIPAPAKADALLAYALARATKIPSRIDSHLINAGPDAEIIANVWDFAVHLYNTQPLSSAYNTQSLGSAVYGEIKDWSYVRDASSQPATLKFPVDDTALTIANIQSGVTMWSIDTNYDYAHDVTSLNTPPLTTYQSTLLANEVAPNVTATSQGTETINSVVARLYDFSAFSLRAGPVELPDTIKEGVALDTAYGSGEGPVTGGTPLRIVAPNGGFGWVQVAFGKNMTGSQPASAFALASLDAPGASEFEIKLHTPPYPVPERVDIGIYLAGDPSKPAVVLPGAFLYTQAKPNCDLWLMLLGLGAALLGLAAGGESGGGGGGPCFIATAAYGTPLAADIDSLRALRDTYLLNNALGTAFVDSYYRVSPFVADLVAKSPVFAAVVRLLLVPVIFAAKVVVAKPALSVLLASVAALTVVRRRKRSKA